MRFAETVAFAHGSTAISQAAGVTLDRVVRWLAAAPDVTIEVRGFARDSAGGKRELLVASERAAHVCTWLAAHGVASNRLVPRGFSNWPDEAGHLDSGVAFEVLTPDQHGCCVE